VADEAADKLGAPGAAAWADAPSWDKTNVDDVPQQDNGFDCGVFLICFASFAALDRCDPRCTVSLSVYVYATKVGL
jgi:hypothetical protein